MYDFAGLKGYTTAKRSVFIIDKDGVIRYRWVNKGYHKNTFINLYSEIDF